MTREVVEGDGVSRSAVDSVLRQVFMNRRPERLIGAELDGRYRIEKQVGEGGMGVVYLAKHIVIEKAVAIKVLRADVAADESVVKRFVQEARAASRIGHPNIIDVTDFGTTKEGLTYQVMEYLEGRTLNHELKEHTFLPVRRALAIVAQMGRALGAAHDKGIVHRDLKPENVFLLERDGRRDFVKIVDFGIAKVLPTKANPNEERLTRAGTVFGTPEYMAPEQAAGRTDVDLRADIYALGIILFEMLTGQVPHRGTSAVNTLAMQMLDEVAPMREYRPDLDISENLEAVIMRSLAKKRAQRYQSMGAFLSAIEEATSSTEFDLPSLMRQESMSSQLFSQRDFDTIPETDLPDSALPGGGQGLAAAGSVAKRGVSRVTDPVFLRSEQPALVPTSEMHSAQMPVPSRARLWIVVAALILVSGSVGAFVLSQQATKPDVSLALAAVDAGHLQAASDAQAHALGDDAGLVGLGDAAFGEEAALPVHVASPNHDKPIKQRTTKSGKADAGVSAPLVGGEREVTVVTRPRGAQLFIGHSYAGSDGLNLRRPSGTKVSVSCQLKGFLDGSVDIRFDGKREVFLCRLREVRQKKCVEGIENPFDDCP